MNSDLVITQFVYIHLFAQIDHSITWFMLCYTCNLNALFSITRLNKLVINFFLYN